MPPKGTKKDVKDPIKTPQKTKAEARETATPIKATKQTAKKAESATTTPKKTKEPIKLSKLARDKKATLPITVTYQGDVAEAKHVKVSYTHALKLDAGAPFTLFDSYVIPEGQQHEGFQVILVKPAQAFKFMKLTPEIRKRIYTFYFFTKGQGSLPITLDGKRKTETKDPYAKSFAEGNKNRVGLLAISKEASILCVSLCIIVADFAQINEEATPVLYCRPLRFESPSVLMAFFADLESPLRIHLRHVEINQYVKKDAKTALAFLAEAKNLEHLRIEVGMAMDDNIAKAARNFWLDACKLLEAVGSKKEKTMVEDKPKPKPQVITSNDDDSSGEDSSDNEEQSGDDEEEEWGDESVTPSASSSDVAKEAATADPVAAEPSSIAEQMDTTEGATEGATESATECASAVPAAAKTEDTVMADNDQNTETDEIVKKDSKSPVPVVAIRKVIATKPGPKMRQGRKSDAVDILHFGKAAFKYKDADKSEHHWDASMRFDFLDALKAKLK